jgi:hypothetical protein
MPTTYLDDVRRVGALDQRRIAALLTIYSEAVDELRSWHDPAVSELIVKLEALRRLIGRCQRID